jgi:hypothetical protein
VTSVIRDRDCRNISTVLDVIEAEGRAAPADVLGPNDDNEVGRDVQQLNS